MFESLKAASEAGKAIKERESIMAENGASLKDNFEMLMSEIKDQQIEQEEISDLFLDEVNQITEDSDIM